MPRFTRRSWFIRMYIMYCAILHFLELVFLSMCHHETGRPMYSHPSPPWLTGADTGHAIRAGRSGGVDHALTTVEIFTCVVWYRQSFQVRQPPPHILDLIQGPEGTVTLQARQAVLNATNELRSALRQRSSRRTYPAETSALKSSRMLLRCSRSCAIVNADS
ncbi:hypothetical protein C8F01DRAFT_108728 [Mycena amicta]|nr:hypothetical protein C8F01DRAFT_108728 [Mycena amicta]